MKKKFTHPLLGNSKRARARREALQTKHLLSLIPERIEALQKQYYKFSTAMDALWHLANMLAPIKPSVAPSKKKGGK